MDATFKLTRDETVLGTIGVNGVKPEGSTSDPIKRKMQQALALGQAGDGGGHLAMRAGKMGGGASAVWYPTLTFQPLVFVASPSESQLMWDLGLSANAVLCAAIRGDFDFKFKIGQIDHTHGGKNALRTAKVDKIAQCYVHLKRKLREKRDKLPQSVQDGWTKDDRKNFLGACVPKCS